jgi:hypothetical protein
MLVLVLVLLLVFIGEAVFLVFDFDNFLSFLALFYLIVENKNLNNE